MIRTNSIWRRFLDGIIILGISIFLLFGIEFALRIFYPEKIVHPQESSYEFNPNYIISLKPNLRRTFERHVNNGGEIIHWETNSKGFRGVEFDNNSDARIIVYGDSNIQAVFSNLPDTFTSKLKKHLNDGSMNVEVINAGVVGFGPDQSLIRFSLEADVYKPVIVILNLCVDNDFGDLIRNRLFELENGKLIRVNHKIKQDELFGPIQSLRRDISSLLVVRSAIRMLGNSVGDKDIEKKKNKLDLIQQEVSDLMSYCEREYMVYKQKKPKSFSHFADHYDIDIVLNPESESSITKQKLMDAVLSEMKRISVLHDIKFLILIQPSVRDTTTNTDLNYENLRKYPSYDRRRLTSIVDNICVFRGIDKINLFDKFISNEPEKLHYLPPDGHWNEYGQDIAAREAAIYIKKSEWLSKSNQ